ICDCPLHFSLLSCFCPPRDRHSFPTRRSSDLQVRVCSCDGRKKVGPGGGIVGELDLQFLRRAIENLDNGDGASIADLAGVAENRSEEHTSELQSREKLVCRLLLEKKKWINASI